MRRVAQEEPEYKCGIGVGVRGETSHSFGGHTLGSAVVGYHGTSETPVRFRNTALKIVR